MCVVWFGRLFVGPFWRGGGFFGAVLVGGVVVVVAAVLGLLGQSGGRCAVFIRLLVRVRLLHFSFAVIFLWRPSISVAFIFFVLALPLLL